MQEIEPVYFAQGSAKYRIKRNESIKGTDYLITYFIYFNVDKDGIWTIYNY